MPLHFATVLLSNTTHARTEHQLRANFDVGSDSGLREWHWSKASADPESAPAAVRLCHDCQVHR